MEHDTKLSSLSLVYIDLESTVFCTKDLPESILTVT